jgi:hypothetical protein
MELQEVSVEGGGKFVHKSRKVTTVAPESATPTGPQLASLVELVNDVAKRLDDLDRKVGSVSADLVTSQRDFLVQLLSVLPRISESVTPTNGVCAYTPPGLTCTVDSSSQTGVEEVPAPPSQETAEVIQIFEPQRVVAVAESFQPYSMPRAVSSLPAGAVPLYRWDYDSYLMIGMGVRIAPTAVLTAGHVLHVQGGFDSLVYLGDGGSKMFTPTNTFLHPEYVPVTCNDLAVMWYEPKAFSVSGAKLSKASKVSLALGPVSVYGPMRLSDSSDIAMSVCNGELSVPDVSNPAYGLGLNRHTCTSIPGFSGTPVFGSQGRILGLHVGNLPGTNTNCAVSSVDISRFLKRAGVVFDSAQTEMLPDLASYDHALLDRHKDEFQLAVGTLPLVAAETWEEKKQDDPSLRGRSGQEMIAREDQRQDDEIADDQHRAFDKNQNHRDDLADYGLDRTGRPRDDHEGAVDGRRKQKSNQGALQALAGLAASVRRLDQTFSFPIRHHESVEPPDFLDAVISRVVEEGVTRPDVFDGLLQPDSKQASRVFQRARRLQAFFDEDPAGTVCRVAESIRTLFPFRPFTREYLNKFEECFPFWCRCQKRDFGSDEVILRPGEAHDWESFEEEDLRFPLAEDDEPPEAVCAIDEPLAVEAHGKSVAKKQAAEQARIEQWWNSDTGRALSWLRYRDDGWKVSHEHFYRLLAVSRALFNRTRFQADIDEALGFLQLDLIMRSEAADESDSIPFAMDDDADLASGPVLYGFGWCLHATAVLKAVKRGGWSNWREHVNWNEYHAHLRQPRPAALEVVEHTVVSKPLVNALSLEKPRVASHCTKRRSRSRTPEYVSAPPAAANTGTVLEDERIALSVPPVPVIPEANVRLFARGKIQHGRRHCKICNCSFDGEKELLEHARTPEHVDKLLAEESTSPAVRRASFIPDDCRLNYKKTTESRKRGNAFDQDVPVPVLDISDAEVRCRLLACFAEPDKFFLRSVAEIKNIGAERAASVCPDLFYEIIEYYRKAGVEFFDEPRTQVSHKDGRSLMRHVAHCRNLVTTKDKPCAPLDPEFYQVYKEITKSEEHPEGVEAASFFVPAEGPDAIRSSLEFQLGRRPGGTMHGEAYDKTLPGFVNTHPRNVGYTYDIREELARTLASFDVTKSSGFAEAYKRGPKSVWVSTDDAKQHLMRLAFQQVVLMVCEGDNLHNLRPEDMIKKRLRDPHKAFIKQELHSEEKARDKRYRVIWVASILTQMVQGCSHLLQNKEDISAYGCSELHGSCLGMGHDDLGIERLSEEFERALRTPGSDGMLHGSDASGWDFTVTRDSIYMDAERRMFLLDPSNEGYEGACYLLACEAACNSCHTICIGQDIWTVDEYGVTASGMLSTSAQNTQIRRFQLRLAGSVAEGGNGDDEFHTPKVDYGILRGFGVITKDNEATANTPEVGLSFTSHWYKKTDGGWTAKFLNLEKMLAQGWWKQSLGHPDVMSGMLFAVRNDAEQTRVAKAMFARFLPAGVSPPAPADNNLDPDLVGFGNRPQVGSA